jgi:hypothetical protein
MIDQLTVFLENEKGQLARLCRVLGDGQVQMHLLMIADTPEYGIARIICDRPAHARNLLTAEGFKAKLTSVAAIMIDDRPGGLATLMEAFDHAAINVEYVYCAAVPEDGGRAIDILKIDPIDDARRVVETAGFRVLEAGDIYELD